MVLGDLAAADLGAMCVLYGNTTRLITIVGVLFIALQVRAKNFPPFPSISLPFYFKFYLLWLISMRPVIQSKKAEFNVVFFKKNNINKKYIFYCSNCAKNLFTSSSDTLILFLSESRFEPDGVALI